MVIVAALAAPLSAQPLGDADEAPFGEFVEDQRQVDPLRDVNQESLQASIARALESLSYREREIIRLGLQGRVTLAGHVHDPAGQLHRFDILLLSSDYEGVPAVVLEGFAAGLPAIVTNCCASMAAHIGSVSVFSAVVPPAVTVTLPPRDTADPLIVIEE